MGARPFFGHRQEGIVQPAGTPQDETLEETLMRSFGQSELLIAMIEAFGQPRPTSFALSELENDLVNAITTSTGGAVYAPDVVTDGVLGGSGTDNAPYLQGLLNAVGSSNQGVSIILPDGPIGLASTLVVPQSSGFTWLRPGPNFNSAAESDATPLPGGGFVALGGFTPDVSGAVLNMQGDIANPSVRGHTYLEGGYVNAGALCPSAVMVNSTAFNDTQCTLMGGTTWTLNTSATTGVPTRGRLNDCHINNVLNGAGNTATAGAINIQGSDWIGIGVNKKAGSLLVSGSDGIWSGCHLTGGTAALPTYPGANLIIQSDVQFVGCIVDSVGLASAGQIQIDRAGEKPPARFSSCKYLGSTASSTPLFFHLNTGDAPILVGGTSLVDGNAAGEGFTQLISGSIANDIWGGQTFITTTGWVGTAPAHIAALFTGTAPVTSQGVFSYAGTVLT
jgi:hypothetical protein